jgi:hypothetical protein
MSFQYIIDNAESISIVKRPVISQTVSRDQRIRSVSRGGNVWKFSVKMPARVLWNFVSRGYVESMDADAMLKNQTINLAKSGYSWITGYRGDATSTTTMTFKYNAAQAASNTFKFELGNMPGAVGSTLFRSGDLIQPNGSNYVYSIVNPVVKGSASTQLVEVHRSILDTPSDTAVTFKVGPAVTWTVICTNLPTWTFVEKELIEFNGNFEFQEVI